MEPERTAANVVTSENREQFMAARMDLKAPIPAAKPEVKVDAAKPADGAVLESNAAGDTKPAGEQTAEQKAEAAERKQKGALSDRFSELTTLRKAAEAQAETEKQARIKAETELAEAKAKLAPPPVDTTTEPQRATFGSDEEFAKAYGKWAVAEAMRERDQQETVKRTESENAALAKAWNERFAAMEAEAPDAKDKIAASAVTLSTEAATAIRASEFGPRILLHFADNPGEAEALGKLTVGAMYKALGKLEAKLDTKQAKVDDSAQSGKVPTVEVSKAPEPIRPLKGSGSVPDVPINSAGEFTGSYQQWKAARNAGKIH